MEQDKYKYRDLALTALYTSIIAYLGYMTYGILLTLYPFLFMRRSVQYGILPTIITMLGSTALIAIFVGPLAGVTLLGMYLPMVLAFHYCIVSGKGFWTAFMSMVIVLLISSLSINMGLAKGVGTIDLEPLVEEAINVQVEVAKGELTGLELSRFETNLRDILDFMISIGPAGFLLSILITVYINFTLAGRQLLRDKILIIQPPILPNLKIPRQTIILAGVCFGTGVILNHLNINTNVDIILNFTVVFGFIYLVSGFATVSYYLYRFRLPFLIRLLVYFMILRVDYLSIIVIAIGFIDSLVGLRARGQGGGER